jgi:PilZ domain
MYRAAQKQRRRLIRRTRQHEAWITFDRGVQSFECQVLDISADGAKLVTDIDAPIGTLFPLCLKPSSAGAARLFGARVAQLESSSLFKSSTAHLEALSTLRAPLPVG